MAAQTGRTVPHFLRLGIGDTGGTLREIPFDAPGDVGLTFDAADVTALQDAIKNMLTGQPGAPIKITGPFDNTAAVAFAASAATPTLSGSHTVLSAICGDGAPHTLFIAVGIRHYYTTGEPVFGLQWASASNSGYTCTKYTGNGNKYSAEFEVMGAIAPAWGTALLTVGS